MTEAEWLTCAEPTTMLYFIRRSGGSDRKLRLFGSACYRSLWATSPVSQLHWDVLRASESYADGQIAKQEFRLIRKPLGGFENPCVAGMAEQVAFSASSECLGETWVPNGENIENAGLGGRVRQRSQPEQLRPQCDSLRDIFGNPFCPFVVNPSWLTSDVVAIAEGIYQERAFDRMPILADALQDAGCDNDDILNHCRNDGPHARGCFVVDLLLGKE